MDDIPPRVDRTINEIYLADRYISMTVDMVDHGTKKDDPSM